MHVFCSSIDVRIIVHPRNTQSKAAYNTQSQVLVVFSSTESIALSANIKPQVLLDFLASWDLAFADLLIVASC